TGLLVSVLNIQCGRLPSRFFGLYILHGDRISGALRFDGRVVERYREVIDREVLRSCRQSQEAGVHDIETLKANRRQCRCKWELVDDQSSLQFMERTRRVREAA